MKHTHIVTISTWLTCSPPYRRPHCSLCLSVHASGTKKSSKSKTDDKDAIAHVTCNRWSNLDVKMLKLRYKAAECTDEKRAVWTKVMQTSNLVKGLTALTTTSDKHLTAKGQRSRSHSQQIKNEMTDKYKFGRQTAHSKCNTWYHFGVTVSTEHSNLFSRTFEDHEFKC